MFDIKNIACEVLNYPLSYAELIATITGLLCVYWASKENILTWPAGIISEVFLFVIFFQVQLYANMFLQIIFFVTSVYGWYKWKKTTDGDKTNISWTSKKGIGLIIIFTIIGTFLTGYLIGNIHQLLPLYFKEASAYPYIDSLIMILSIAATILLAKKKIENWALWLINNIACVVLYSMQGIYFIALQYMIFIFMAFFGFYNWYKKQNNG